jgi:hypothetical protein
MMCFFIVDFRPCQELFISCYIKFKESIPIMSFSCRFFFGGSDSSSFHGSHFNPLAAQALRSFRIAPPTAWPSLIFPYRCSLTDCCVIPSRSAICRWLMPSKKYIITMSRCRGVRTVLRMARSSGARIPARYSRLYLHSASSGNSK